MSNCQVCTADTDAFLCRACLNEIDRAIGDMTSLMHEVSLVATKQTNVYRSSGRPDSQQRETEAWNEEQAQIAAWLRSKDGRVALPSTALMVNLDARELLWVAGNTLSGWTRHLAESRATETPTAAGMIGWLLTYVESIRWDEAAGEMHDEITSLHRDLERAVDRSLDRVFAGPCTGEVAEGVQCGLDLYFAGPKAESIKCDGWRSPGQEGCGATYTITERREWLIGSLDDALVTVDDMLNALPSLFPELMIPRRHSVNSWIRDKRIISHGKNYVGEPTFVGGELLALIRAYKPHKYGPRHHRSDAA